MSSCLGRLVSDAVRLKLSNGEYFHLPLRCDGKIIDDGDLCSRCKIREKKTISREEAMTGTRMDGSHPALLHGKIGEPIPFWSRVYDGTWFRLKLKEGITVSEDDMAKAKAAAAKAQGDVATVAEPEALPPGGQAPKRGRKKGSSGSGAVSVTAMAAAEEPPKAIVLNPKPVSIEEVVEIKVIKKEIDGRSYYYDSKKEKVYDMKCRYVGRWLASEDKVVSFPDSDAE